MVIGDNHKEMKRGTYKQTRRIRMVDRKGKKGIKCEKKEKRGQRKGER